MALTNTTLSAACGASDLTLAVTSTSSGFPAVGTYTTPHQLMRIGGEDMLIQVVPVANTVKVMQRGYNGTAAVAHEALSVITTSSDPADFGANPTGGDNSRPPYVEDIVTIGVDTTFTAAGTAPTATTLPLPTKNTRYIITKASACAITLISATAAQMGVKMTFQNGVAAANTITYTPGFRGDTTSSDVATSATKVGPVFVCTVGYTGLFGDENTGTGTGWTIA
jgi:hypothetical protein